MAAYLPLIVENAWWDSVDSLRKAFSLWVFKHRQHLETMMASLAEADNFWLRRTAITLQLLWKQQTDLVWLERSILLRIVDQEFFIQKGIAWALREYSKTDPLWVAQFLDQHQHQLSALARREAGKYL
ncbi:MAG: DNA alkylation repair protein [Enterobacteriaceae bacterium]